MIHQSFNSNINFSNTPSLWSLIAGFLLLYPFYLTSSWQDFFFFSVTINLHWKAVQMPSNSFRVEAPAGSGNSHKYSWDCVCIQGVDHSPRGYEGTWAVSFGVGQQSSGENACRKLASNWEVFHAGSVSREQQECHILLSIIVTNHCILSPSVNRKLPARCISVVHTKYLTDRHSENACWINEWMRGQMVW